MALPQRKFTKVALTVDDQLQKMVARGVVVEDEPFAKYHLEKIGFYRLSGYAEPFQIGGNGADRHHCKEPVPFEKLIERYSFDRKLRLLMLDAIERIEVSLRSSFSNSIALNHGSHWYLENKLFEPSYDHAQMMNELKRQIGHTANTDEQLARRDVFIQHYYDNYNDPETPPSWMVFEAVSFGFVSKVFENLFKSETTHFCLPLKVPHDVLSSWLHTVSYVRNLCAHHSRVWNRTLTIKPAIAKKHKTKFFGNDKIYSVIVVMKIMLDTIMPDNDWAERLAGLLDEYPEVPRANMGFPDDWKNNDFWRIETNS